MRSGAGSLRRRFASPRRRPALVAVVLAFASACATEAPEEAGPVSEVSDVPARWVGAVAGADEIRVTVAKGHAAPDPVTTISALGDPESGEMAPVVTDLAFDDSRDLAFLATCCEPASGTLSEIGLADPPAELEGIDQGTNVDVLSGSETFARSDGFGNARVTVAGETVLREGVGASDVALSRIDGAIRLAVLVDTERLRRLIPDVALMARELIVEELIEDQWIGVTYSLEEAASYCGIAYVTGDHVGLLRASDAAGEPWECIGSEVAVYDLGTQTFRNNTLDFPEPVRHVSADASSSYLIYTTVSGAVGWRSTEGEGAGELAQNGYQAADW